MWPTILGLPFQTLAYGVLSPSREWVPFYRRSPPLPLVSLPLFLSPRFSKEGSSNPLDLRVRMDMA